MFEFNFNLRTCYLRFYAVTQVCFCHEKFVKIKSQKEIGNFYIKVKSVSDSEVKPGMFIKNPISIQMSRNVS